MLEDIIQELVDVRIIRTGKFTLSNGNESNFYANLRDIAFFPKQYLGLGSLMSKKAALLQANTILAVATGGIPYANVITLKTGIPSTYYSKKRKNHGMLPSQPYGETLLVDDVITSGETKIPIIQEYGVKKVLVVLDREEGGKQAVEKEGAELHSLFTKSDVLKVIASSL